MWVPRCQFPTDPEGRFPGGVLCPLCSHIHIPNGIMPEGPAMVKLPWGECHPKEAPQPSPTGCQLLRPDFLLRLHSHAHRPVCPWPVWLILGSGASGTSESKGPTAFPLFLPVPHPCSERKLPEKNSLLSSVSCNSALSTFIPSSLSLDEVQQKSSSFSPHWDFEIGDLQGSYSLLLPSANSQRNWGCWSDKGV